MSLQRAEILRHVRDLIVATGVVEARVWINSGERAQDELLPCVNVVGVDESVRVLNDEPRNYMRTLRMATEIHAADADQETLNDAVHALCEAVERAVLAERYLGEDQPDHARANDVRLVRVSMMFQDGARKLLAGAVIEFEVDYVYDTISGEPSDIAAFLHAHVDYDLLATGAAVDATDDVLLPQDVGS